MEAGGGVRNMTAAERAQAATALWNSEKGTAMAVIILGWLSKVRKYSAWSVSRHVTLMYRFTSRS